MDHARDNEGQRVRELFDRALDLERHARAAFLEEACGGDGALRSRVEALLAGLSRMDGFMEPSLDDDATPPSVGPWVLAARLGRGGMGVVHEATHRHTGATAAVKVLRVAGGPELQGIRREIHALSSLRHPGIVRILDHGDDAGVPWFAMELVEGRTLRARLGTGAAGDDLASLLGTMRRLCLALSYLHGEGIVHRDLKPENVLVRPSGDPLVIDFGLSTRTETSGSRETLRALGDTSGTLAYMAPEQLAGGVVDPRADLFSVGCMLHELLFGQLPDGEEAPISGRDVPRELVAIVESLLEPDPGKRLGHAEDVAEALARAGAGAPWPGAPPRRPFLYRPSLAGRGREMEELGRRLELLGAGAGGLVLLAGEAGAGKSRLLLEVATEAQRRGLTVFAAECRPPDAVGPLRALRPVLLALADRCRELGEDETPRLLGASGRLLAAIEPGLASVPGFDRLPEPPALGEEALRGWLLDELAILLSHRAPCALLVDDLQWADPMTVQLLERLPRGGVLVLAAYRQEARTTPIERLEARPGGEAPVVIPVGRLGDDAIDLLARSMLAAAELPPALATSLGRHTDGNPFYAAEYLRAAVAHDLLTRDVGRGWRLPEGATLDALPVPRTIRDLVADRLAGLSPAARGLASLLAVFGRPCEAGLLAAASPLPEPDRLEALTELLRQRVLEERQPGHYALSHDRIRDVAYEGLPPDERRALHVGVARSYGSLPREHRTPHLAEIALHWERAGDVERARAGYLVAARAAARGLLRGDAERSYRRILELGSAPAEIDARAHYELAEHVLRYLGRLEEAMREAALAREAAARLGMTDVAASASLSLGAALQQLGRAAEAEQRMREAAETARSAGDRSLVATVLLFLSELLREGGRYAEAAAVCRESRQLCDATGDKRGIALCLQVEALVSSDEGRASEALLQRAAEALHEEGLREAEANVLLMLGTAEADRARFPEARRAYERARGLVQAAESPELAARLASAMADVERRRGRLGEARVLLQESGEIVRRLGQPRELACHLAKEAQLLLDAGEPGGALSRALEAVEHAGRAGNPRVEILARQTLAACHLVLGDVGRAQALLAPPVEGGFPSQDLDGTTHLYLGRSRLQAGDLEGARLSLRLALELALARGDRLLEGACLLEQGLAAIPTGAAGAAEARALLLRVDAVVRDLDLLPGSALARDAERLRLALGS